MSGIVFNDKHSNQFDGLIINKISRPFTASRSLYDAVDSWSARSILSKC